MEVSNYYGYFKIMSTSVYRTKLFGFKAEKSDEGDNIFFVLWYRSYTLILFVYTYKIKFHIKKVLKKCWCVPAFIDTPLNAIKRRLGFRSAHIGYDYASEERESLRRFVWRELPYVLGFRFITIYKGTHHYGGAEEGGWYYWWDTPLATVTYNKYYEEFKRGILFNRKSEWDYKWELVDKVYENYKHKICQLDNPSKEYTGGYRDTRNYICAEKYKHYYKSKNKPFYC